MSGSGIQPAVASFLLGMEPLGRDLWVFLGLLFTAILIAQTVAYFRLTRLQSGSSTPLAPSVLYSPIAFAVTFLAFIVIMRMPGVARLALNPDEFGLIGGAQTLLLDPRFWISVDNTTLGPLATYSVAFMSLIVGEISYGSIKLLGVGVWALSAFALYRAFANLYGELVARVAVLPMVVCAAGLTYWDYVAYNGEHIPVLLLAIAFYLFSKVDTIGITSIYAFLLGLVLGLMPYAKIQAGPIAFVFGVVTLIYLLHQQRRQQVFVLIVGAIVPSFLLMLYLIISGALYDFWQSYILNNLIYAQEGFFGQTQGVSFKRRVRKFLEVLFYAPDSKIFFFSQGVFIVGMAIMLVSKVRSVTLRYRYHFAIAGVVSIASVYSVVQPGNTFTHYLLLLVVPATFFAGSILGIFAYISQHTIVSGSAKTPAIYYFAGVFLIATAVAQLSYTLSKGNIAFDKLEHAAVAGKTTGEAAKLILGYALPGDRMAIWGSGLHLYGETGLAQGTKEAHTERQLREGSQQRYYIDRFVDDIETNRPKFFVEVFQKNSKKGDPDDYRRYEFKRYPKVKDVVEKYYDFLAEIEEGCNICEGTVVYNKDSYIARVRIYVAKDDVI